MKVVREAASGGRDAEHVKLKMEIKVEVVDYGKEGSVFRIRGKNILENEHVKSEDEADIEREEASHVSIPKTPEHSQISVPPTRFRILEKVKVAYDIPIVTDVHESIQCEAVGKGADVIHIPAFLCQQTDLLGMVNSAEKIRLAGNENVMVCERGTTFGHNDLIVDPHNFEWMREAYCPIVADITHSLQQPAGRQLKGGGVASGGLRELIPCIARTAVAVGVDGISMEVHDDPRNAPVDGPTQWSSAPFGGIARRANCNCWCEEGKGVHLVRWETVSLSREKGGLAIGNIVVRNITLLGKWLWRFSLESESLWCFVVKSKYGVQSNVGNRENIRFWEDFWLGDISFARSCPILYWLVCSQNVSIASKFE
ncbi:unnamed protein product [Camellia sinensis]